MAIDKNNAPNEVVHKEMN